MRAAGAEIKGAEEAETPNPDTDPAALSPGKENPRPSNALPNPKSEAAEAKEVAFEITGDISKKLFDVSLCY